MVKPLLLVASATLLVFTSFRDVSAFPLSDAIDNSLPGNETHPFNVYHHLDDKDETL